MTKKKCYQFVSSPWGFRETPFSEQFKWLKAKGFNYYCTQFFEEGRGVLSPDITDEQIAEFLALAESYNLKCASFNVNGDFMLPDFEAEIAKCCAEIDKAAKFSPKVLILFAGWQDRRDDAIYVQVSHSLKQVARHAAKYNLSVALENHGGLTTTAQQVNRILDGVGEPNMGFNYDPANFLMHGAEPLDALKQIEQPIFFTHFKSVKYEDGKKVYCRLNEGVIDFLPILKYLDEIYSGFYAVEYEETSDVFEGSEDDLKTLKALLSKI